MPGTRTLAAMTALCALQGAPIDGTWELTRVFRSGAAPAATRAVALDSTVYVRITLESHPGGWISGRLYRRYHGEPDRSKVEAGPLRGTGRWIRSEERRVGKECRCRWWRNHARSEENVSTE